MCQRPNGTWNDTVEHGTFPVCAAYRAGSVHRRKRGVHFAALTVMEAADLAAVCRSVARRVGGIQRNFINFVVTFSRVAQENIIILSDGESRPAVKVSRRKCGVFGLEHAAAENGEDTTFFDLQRVASDHGDILLDRNCRFGKCGDLARVKQGAGIAVYEIICQKAHNSSKPP